jgi:hypothetical protein
MSSDDRNWLMRKVLSMDQSASVSYFYPRLFPVVSNEAKITRVFTAIKYLKPT